jgi:hypothetical protein
VTQTTLNWRDATGYRKSAMSSSKSRNTGKQNLLPRERRLCVRCIDSLADVGSLLCAMCGAEHKRQTGKVA